MPTSERPVGFGGDTSAAAMARWPRVRAAAEAALALAPEVRAGFLDSACGADAVLRAEAEAQVDACERVAASALFLAEPAAAFAAPLLTGFHGIGDDERDDAEPVRPASAELTALRTALAERYEIEREIGRGGTATVYLAHDLRHGRRVALKVLDPVLGAALSAERFLREIRVTAGLMHPHILPLHDSAEAAGRLYYVMPFVEGETLRERLAREGPLPVAEAVRLMREVAAALDYAHRRGIVHRDIKPANILLADGHAVVADFGIARAVHRAREAQEPEASSRDEAQAGDTLTDVGTSPGTPAYMAPEQARDGGIVDCRADLYALGVVAYETLAGAHPFGARAPQALIAAHLGEAPPRLAGRRPDLPPALAALVMRLLAKDPGARPASAAAVLQALEGVSTKPRWVGTARRRALFVCLALLVTLGAVGYAMWRVPAAPGSRHGAAGRGKGAPPVVGAPRFLAVLPFENTSGDPQDDYFSGALTDELTHILGRQPGLRVAGRTSSNAFKGKAVAPQEVGRALGVGAVVGGTVRRADGRLRVTAQMVRTADGAVLWDSVYERRAGDAIAVEDDVTRGVAAAVALVLGGRGVGSGPSVAHGSRGTTDAEAYEFYLKGRYYMLERGAANVARAIGFYQQAIARDPTFARGHAGLAGAYAVLPIYVPDPSDSVTALVAASAARALAFDSTLADAQIALGLAFAREGRFRDAEARYRAALAVEPSSVSAHQALGLLLLTLGRTTDALAEAGRATQLDPLAKSAGTAHALALLSARRFPEAVVASRRTFALDSTFSLAFWALGLAQTFSGQSDRAVRILERGMQVHPETPGNYSALVLAYAAAGRWTDADRLRAKLRRAGGDPSGGVMAAFAELVFGDREPLVRLLSTAAGQRRWIDAEGALGCHPLLDPLWADARFRTAMRRLSVEECALARPWPFANGAPPGETRRRASPS